MAKKRKSKKGVRWVGPAKLVAESQDSAYGSGGANPDAGPQGGGYHVGSSGMGFTSGKQTSRSKPAAKKTPPPKKSGKKK